MSTRGPRRDGDGGANDVRSLGFNDLINSMDPHDRAVIHNQRARHARGDGRERSRSRRRVSWRDGGKNRGMDERVEGSMNERLMKKMNEEGKDGWMGGMKGRMEEIFRRSRKRSPK